MFLAGERVTVTCSHGVNESPPALSPGVRVTVTRAGVRTVVAARLYVCLQCGFSKRYDHVNVVPSLVCWPRPAGTTRLARSNPASSAARSPRSPRPRSSTPFVNTSATTRRCSRGRSATGCCRRASAARRTYPVSARLTGTAGRSAFLTLLSHSSIASVQCSCTTSTFWLLFDCYTCVGSYLDNYYKHADLKMADEMS